MYLPSATMLSGVSTAAGQNIMKYYIRPTSRTGRLVMRLNRSFSTGKAAKDALKDWLTEANHNRKAKGQEPLRVGDFKFIHVDSHPYVGRQSVRLPGKIN